MYVDTRQGQSGSNAIEYWLCHQVCSQAIIPLQKIDPYNIIIDIRMCNSWVELLSWTARFVGAWLRIYLMETEGET
jgi:hypothetical protein